MRMIQNRIDFGSDKVTEFFGTPKPQINWTIENKPGCQKFDAVQDSAHKKNLYLYQLYVD